MRVVFLLHAHPDLQAGGTEIFARNLFHRLRDEHGVEGLFIAGTADHQRPDSPGTPFQAIGQDPDHLLIRTNGFDPFFLSQTDLYGVAKPLAQLLAQFDPDIVHIHHFLTLGIEVVGLIRRTCPRAKLVMTLHDYYPICAHDGQMVTTDGRLCRMSSSDGCARCFPSAGLTGVQLRQLHVQQAMRQIDAFVAPSLFLLERFKAWGLDSSRLHHIANGLAPVRRLDPPLPNPPLPKRLRKHPPPQVSSHPRNRFGFFGHINRFKGALVALEASRLLSNEGIDHQLIVRGGTDHQADDVVDRFKSALVQAPMARFLGPYRQEELAQYMMDIDWVVFPSVWWENAPLVIQESFAYGRPIIGSDLGGVKEAIRHNTDGLLFAVGDAHQLAQRMREGMDPTVWERLQRGIAPPYSLSDSANEHLSFYQHLIGKRTAP